LQKEIDWFSLQDGEYIELKPDLKGIIRSQIFLGLWLAVEAMLAGEMPEVLSVLQAGLNSTATSNTSF